MAMATCCCLLPAFPIFRASATGRPEKTNAAAAAADAAWRLPARDRRIDFGKHRGRMLGTLPRNYLVWMANKLQGSEEAMWADWAEEVLEDPHYADKLEWEKLEKELLRGNALHLQHPWRIPSRNQNGDGNTLNGKMKAYGWDLDCKDGWNRVNISRLGTSKGGRIPRKRGGSARLPEDSSMPSLGKFAADDNSFQDELVQRRRMRRTRNLQRQNPQEEAVSVAPPVVQDLSPFPGRGALLKRFNTQ